MDKIKALVIFILDFMYILAIWNYIMTFIENGIKYCNEKYKKNDQLKEINEKISPYYNKVNENVKMGMEKVNENVKMGMEKVEKTVDTTVKTVKKVK